MSLIPSESYSFPDHFTSTVTPSRKPKPQENPQARKVHRKPEIVALPDPEPESQPLIATELGPEPSLAAAPAFEPEFVPEIWEPEVPRANGPKFPPAPPVDPAPNRELISEMWQPDVPQIKTPPPAPAPRPVPNPAIRRAQAPPARIPETPVRKIALPASLKPKVRWNNRAPAMDPSANRNNGNNGNGNGNGDSNGANVVPAPPMPPAQNVIPMKPARPAPPSGIPTPRPPQPVAPRPRQPVAPRPPQAIAPRQVVPHAPVSPQAVRTPAPTPVQMRPVQPRPAPVQPKPAPPKINQPEFFEMFEENAYEIASQRRREMKFRRFIACEGAALVVLLPLVVLGLTLNISAPALRWIMNILTIASAVAAAVIPIVFYAATPTLPEIER